MSGRARAADPAQTAKLPNRSVDKRNANDLGTNRSLEDVQPNTALNKQRTSIQGPSMSHYLWHPPRKTLALALAFGLTITACGSDGTTDSAATSTEAITATTASTATGDNTPTSVLTAEEGAAAREERAALTAGVTAEGAAAASLVATDGRLADSALECGGEIYVPTAEELAAVNADVDALAATFDTFGITYTTSVDDTGYAYIDYDYNDAVIQSVADSFWRDRYPVQPPAQEDLDSVRATNDVLAAALDAAGVAYTRTTDDAGWENLEWDYDNLDAQAAIDAAYAELYPPIPPSAEDLAYQSEENSKLMAAFDAAGVPYTLMTDELGWAWVEWDYLDESVNERVNAVFNALYPVDLAVDPEVGCFSEGDAVAVGEEGDATEAAVVDPAESSIAIEERGFTAEEIAARDADVDGLANGFAAAGVDYEVWGESPWRSVSFDINNDASVAVVAAAFAARG
jgi:hypothetical protein